MLKKIELYGNLFVTDPTIITHGYRSDFWLRTAILKKGILSVMRYCCRRKTVVLMDMLIAKVIIMALAVM